MSRYDERYDPITPQDIAGKKRSLEEGDVLLLPVMHLDPDEMAVTKKMEKCRLLFKSRHLAVFRQPSGRKASWTYVELCMMDRGAVF